MPLPISLPPAQGYCLITTRQWLTILCPKFRALNFYQLSTTDQPSPPNLLSPEFPYCKRDHELPKQQFQLSMVQVFGHALDEAAPVQPGAAVYARPHALPDHVPELQGALQVCFWHLPALFWTEKGMQVDDK